MTENVERVPTALDGPRLATFSKWILPLLLGLSLGTRLWYANISPLSYDETHNLMIGMLAKQGYAPYREIYSVIMPFAVLTMEASASIWGATAGVRGLMILYGLASIVALFFLVRRQTKTYATLAALLAATFFSFNPHYFFVSTSINLEAGALALGLISVALIEVHRTRSAWGWIFLSGVLFGLSTTFKVFVPFLPAIIGAQLLFFVVAGQKSSLRAGQTYWKVVKLGLIWLGGALLVGLFFLAIFDRPGLIEQVLTSRFELREAIEADEIGINIAESLSAADLVQYAPLLLATVAGIYALWRQRLVQAWIWPLWFLLAALFLLSHDPVRPRHTVMLLPPLAALGGIGIAQGLHMLGERQPDIARWANPLLVIGLMGWAIWAPFSLIEVEGFVEKHPARQAAIHLVQQTTAPDDCIISKENRLHFLADRLSTPHLSLISTARLFSGLLPAQDIAREADERDCPVLIYAETFDRLIPDLRRLAAGLYALKLTIVDPREPGYSLDVYATKMNTHAAPSHVLERLFGRSVGRPDLVFEGFDLTPSPWQRGQQIHLSTYWEAQQEIDTDYKIFVHLLDEQGDLVRAYDHYPFELKDEYQIADIVLNPQFTSRGTEKSAEVANAPAREVSDTYPATGLIPTRLWLPGQILKETLVLPLPADIEPGIYGLSIGMYDESTMERLPVHATEQVAEQNHIPLGTFQVE